MGEQRYLISDAAKMVAVEAHVLRYWEEELGLSIGRTELGHRYYTRENIETFRNVKKLKEEGLQLRAIKVVLQNTDCGAQKENSEAQCGESDAPVWNVRQLAVMRSNAQRLEQFKELVGGIVEKAIKDNNEELQRRFEESMAKETNYLLHMQEQREEEHFRRLDEAIRARQKNSRYVAAAKEKPRFWHRLHKKRKDGK